MAPTVIVFAPGRVELLGNHTDYNDGVALAAAIDRGVTIRAEKIDGDLLEVSSETNGREVSKFSKQHFVSVNHEYGRKSTTSSPL